MIRDPLMKALVEKEPLTPFTDRVRELYEGLPSRRFWSSAAAASISLPPTGYTGWKTLSSAT